MRVKSSIWWTWTVPARVSSWATHCSGPGAPPSLAQYASVGAGGSTNAIILPGGIQFNYTWATELDDTTGMPTFQFVGVVPDVKVPVTEATETEKLEGGDPVMDAARAYLHSQELSNLETMPVTFGEGTIATVAPANWQPDPEGVKYTSPDGTSSMAFSAYTHTDAADADAVAAALGAGTEKVAEHESEAGAWSIYELSTGTEYLVMAVITIDGTPYIGLLAGEDEPMLAALTVNVLYPALDAFTVAAEAVSTPPANVGEAWASVSCDTFNLPSEVAAQADCGYVTVPEFHSQPDGPTIQVAVVRVPSNGDNPAPDPMFMEQGGPGGSTIQVFAIDAFPAPIIQSILATRDLVFVEQRGTFYSRPSLVCTEEVDHDIQVASELIDNLDRTWVATCRDRLLDEGVNFDAFNSVENAADMYFVAETLGYDSFNYYGVSYGTLLGQYVIEQAEEHEAQPRSVILDAVIPSNIEFNAPAGSTGSYALRNLFAECAQDEVCNERFPDLETIFLSLIEELNQEPIPITFTVTDEKGEPVDTIDANLDGNEFATAVFLTMYNSGADRLLPYNIYQSAQNDEFGWVADVLSPGYSPAPEAHGMHVSVLCPRANSNTVDGTTFFEPPYPELTFLGEGAAEELRLDCGLIEVADEEPFVLDNLDTPTLIVNGTRDPIAPRPYGEFVGSQLSTAYVITVPGTGHGSIFTLQCAGDIVLDFLATPTQAPDQSCLSETQPEFEYGEE